jgi:CheY-like chemotaxis protein
MEASPQGEAATETAEQSLQTPSSEAQFEKRSEEPKQVVSKPPQKVEAPLPSEAAIDVAEQPLPTLPSGAQLEMRLEESTRVVSMPLDKLEAPSPIESANHAVEQSLLPPTSEAQLELRFEECEPVASKPPEKVEAHLPGEEATDAAEPEAPLAEPQLDNSTEDGATDTALLETEELVFVPWRTGEPVEVIVPVPETLAPEEHTEVCHTPDELHPEPSLEAAACSTEPLAVDQPAENPAVLETQVEKVETEIHAEVPPGPSVPSRAAEPLESSVPAPETPPFEDQTNTLPTPAAEVSKPAEPPIEPGTTAGAQSNEKSTVDTPAEKATGLEAPVEQSASEAYGMIPPAPSAPVPGRAEFEAAYPQSEGSLVEEEAIELVPGLLAGSAAQCDLPSEKPGEPIAETPKTEEVAEETKPASVSLALPTETSVPDLTNPIEPETAADMSRRTEDCLPPTLAPEPESEKEAANESLQQPAKTKVLVVDDDPTLRMLLKMGLERHGYECLLAENGKAAQAVVQANHPALILVDLLMPVMDGLTFVQWLRETAQDSTPVLVLTNVDDAKITQEALDNGANAFACKPLRLKELLQTIEELVPS